MKLLFCLLLSCTLLAQEKYRISGNVRDAKTGMGIPGASVYLEGSTFGAQADSLGNFYLKRIPTGRYRMVASFVGYKHKIQQVEILKESKALNIFLEEDNQTLDEVRVSSSRDKTWEKQIRTFEKAFLGDSYNSKEVHIQNKEVVNFEQDDDRLIATAFSPLIIENQSLGYKITYTLDRLEKTRDLTSFRGLARYELMHPLTLKQQKRWDENRQEAYLGSLSHFLKALMENDLESAGFNAYLLKPGIQNTSAGRRGFFFDISTTRHFPFQSAELIKPYRGSELYYLNTQNAIELVYNQRRVLRPVFPDAPYPYTILIPKGLVLLGPSGNLMDPFSLEMRGDMGRIGMAELLPLDYTP
ncbi:MAG: hypothetical protein RLZZ474_593 [Bacteroidota bacterium]|jgi:hypothetical protein